MLFRQIDHKIMDWNTTFYSNCQTDWPLQICVFANICGLTSSVIWFLVLLPQLYRNFRHKTVEGLSFGWAFANFTAAMNNAFFVFKWGTLPLFSKISAVYMPILEGVMIIQFWFFKRFSQLKVVLLVLCVLIWTVLILLQVFLSVYDWMQWISVVLWSVESFPQAFLNMERQSTEGLSLMMIVLTAVGKTTDFCSTYLLIMPIQNVVMCYFSSSVAYIVTLQVIYYWKQSPVDDQGHQSADDLETVKNVPTTFRSCNIVRFGFATYFSVLLLSFAVCIVWRTATWIALIAPIGIMLILLLAYIYYWTSYGSLIRREIENITCLSNLYLCYLCAEDSTTDRQITKL